MRIQYLELWEEGKGFILDLSHEYDYDLDPERHESLEPALSRYQQGHFLDEYYSLFGPLAHFVRKEEQNRTMYPKTAERSS
jgi:hypothetical protein